ncbi:AraC family transcriptional regulator [Izhakiella australiensis]|uniref:AraC family transcriptional regulator n=1 Tax=Izhakiella australiensis TaxID=1926881 RepID=A0A1S8YNL2_9GAMM|nr:AraC family transcriptional regulator [Izhakiella australiensis]OON40751.1 AraC family transcriptional regulator [Izhakiella australiensis]
MPSPTPHWVSLTHDAVSGIEAIRAHFTGHAYDPHFHDSYLVGVTEQGVQQFHSRRQRHRSRPGTSFLLEPGDLHDGDAIDEQGFTYRMLYLAPQWLQAEMANIWQDKLPAGELQFAATLAQDKRLAAAVFHACQTFFDDESALIKEAGLQQLLTNLVRHQRWFSPQRVAAAPRLAYALRDYLCDNLAENITLQQAAHALQADRFRLTRAFQAEFGLSPHAWLIQKRLNAARQMLACGMQPAAVAFQTGFADQSHLGRWFRRAFQLTPARYRQRCTNLPDVAS